MWVIADIAGNPVLGVLAGPDTDSDCHEKSKAASGPVLSTSPTPNDIGARRSKLIEDYRNAKPRSKARLICEHELRRVTMECLR